MKASPASDATTHGGPAFAVQNQGLGERVATLVKRKEKVF
jgi:hypothetical protein